MLDEALEHLVRGVVDHPEDVAVTDRTLRRGRVLEVRVHPDDLGRVIGRSGRTRPGVPHGRRRAGARPRRAHRLPRRQQSVAEPRGRHGGRRRPDRPAPGAARRGLTVEVRTDEPDARLAPGCVLLTRRRGPAVSDPPVPAGDGVPATLTVASSREQGGRLVLGFAGVPNRTAAERLRDVLVAVEVDPDRRPSRPRGVLRPPARGAAGPDARSGRARPRRRGARTSPRRTSSWCAAAPRARCSSRSSRRSSPPSTSRPGRCSWTLPGLLDTAAGEDAP